MKLISDPPFGVDDMDHPVWQEFFYGMKDSVNSSRMYDGGGSAWPTVADIRQGSWAVWINKATLQVRIYTNVQGVLKYVELT